LGDKRSWKRELEGDKRGVGKSGSIMEGSFGRHGELKERERERESCLFVCTTQDKWDASCWVDGEFACFACFGG